MQESLAALMALEKLMSIRHAARPSVDSENGVAEAGSAYPQQPLEMAVEQLTEERAPLLLCSLLDHHVKRITFPLQRVVGFADEEGLDHMDTPIGQVLPANTWLIGAVVVSTQRVGTSRDFIRVGHTPFDPVGLRERESEIIASVETDPVSGLRGRERRKRADVLPIAGSPQLPTNIHGQPRAGS